MLSAALYFLCCLSAIIVVITFDEALANIVIIFAVLFYVALLYFSVLHTLICTVTMIHLYNVSSPTRLLLRPFIVQRGANQKKEGSKTNLLQTEDVQMGYKKTR